MSSAQPNMIQVVAMMTGMYRQESRTAFGSIAAIKAVPPLLYGSVRARWDEAESVR